MLDYQERMFNKFNPHRQSYMKYDNTHYLLFLNEQEAEQTNEIGEKIKGYTYTGPRQDGSTLIEATEVTSENIRGKFIAGLLGLEYSIDDQIALLANGEDSEEHSKELARFLTFRQSVKEEIDKLLSVVTTLRPNVE